MNKDELTTARREAERRLRRYDLGERVYDEETISVCKAVPYLLDENEALRAALREISSAAGPTAKWARDIAEQALGDAS